MLRPLVPLHITNHTTNRHSLLREVIRMLLLLALLRITNNNTNRHSLLRAVIRTLRLLFLMLIINNHITNRPLRLRSHLLVAIRTALLLTNSTTADIITEVLPPSPTPLPVSPRRMLVDMVDSRPPTQDSRALTICPVTYSREDSLLLLDLLGTLPHLDRLVKGMEVHLVLRVSPLLRLRSQVRNNRILRKVLLLMDMDTDTAMDSTIMEVVLLVAAGGNTWRLNDERTLSF